VGLVGAARLRLVLSASLLNPPWIVINVLSFVSRVPLCDLHQCFTMTLLAEWGDRSQIATIALAAAKDPVGTLPLI